MDRFSAAIDMFWQLLDRPGPLLILTGVVVVLGGIVSGLGGAQDRRHILVLFLPVMGIVLCLTLDGGMITLLISFILILVDVLTKLFAAPRVTPGPQARTVHICMLLLYPAAVGLSFWLGASLTPGMLAQRHANGIAEAIHHYYREHHTYPATLAELTPYYPEASLLTFAQIGTNEYVFETLSAEAHLSYEPGPGSGSHPGKADASLIWTYHDRFVCDEGEKHTLFLDTFQWASSHYDACRY